MDDNEFPGPMTMVKIDGAKIKKLREQQGLTQLYLATAVQVTTDTISRWENRRYPSIKKENGLKLAEALNVDLNDLLEDETDVETENQTTGEQPHKPDSVSPMAGHLPLRKIWPLVVLSSLLLAILLLFIWNWYNSDPTPSFSANRILPSHCIEGQSYPVVIEIVEDPEKSAAVIIKETLPEHATLVSTSPDITSRGIKNNEIKWLKKITGKAVFAYVLKMDKGSPDVIKFSGTAAIGGESATPKAIGGDHDIHLGVYHWADSNEDNRISDSEILAVYDKYSEIKAIDLDLDTIEEIWLGSGYIWDKKTSSFKIME